MSDRNEWFKDVKRLIRGLEVETVEDPFACPTVKSVTDGEDVLHALGLHPSRDVCGIVNVDIDEVMSCYFCGGSHIASIHSAPDRGGCNWSVGSMTLMRRYDGEPIVRVELDTSVMLDVSVNGSCGDCVSADVTADAYIEDIKYCPFCGEEL